MTGTGAPGCRETVQLGVWEQHACELERGHPGDHVAVWGSGETGTTRAELRWWTVAPVTDAAEPTRSA